MDLSLKKIAGLILNMTGFVAWVIQTISGTFWYILVLFGFVWYFLLLNNKVPKNANSSKKGQKRKHKTESTENIIFCQYMVYKPNSQEGYLQRCDVQLEYNLI